MPKVADVRCRLFTCVTEGPSSAHANPLRAWQGAAADAERYRFQEWLVVEVELTDGTIGIGNEALAPRVARAIILDYLRPMVQGAPVVEREAIWQQMFRSIVAFGQGGVGMAALSAIDIALWDAMGKVLGLPVFDLLGGRKHASMPVYASQLYPTDDLDSLAQEAAAYAAAGFGMVKQRLLSGPREGVNGMRKNVDLVRTVRMAVGDEVDVAVDAYMGWDLDYASRMIPLLEPFGLRWVEEPLLPVDRAGYRTLRDRVGIPIAGGEHESTLNGIAELIIGGAVDVAQPDVNRVGGLTVAQKVCAVAEAVGVPVIPHAGQVHNYHLVAACPGAIMAEYFPANRRPLVGNEMPHLLFEGEPLAADGEITLMDAPGLGIAVAPRDPVRELTDPV